MRTIPIALLMTLAMQVQGHHELANRNLETVIEITKSTAHPGMV